MKKIPFSRMTGWTLLCAGMFAAQHSLAQTATCKYVVSNSWGSGATANIEITNTGNTVINGWSVNWSYVNNRISNSWNATLAGSNPYTASNLSWNASIQPGGSVSFGVQVNANGTVETPVINGAICKNAGPISASTSSAAVSSQPKSYSSSLRSNSSVSSSRSSVIPSSSSKPSSRSSSSVAQVSQECEGGAIGGRAVECLGRGVFAQRKGNDAFITWRLLGYDDPNTGFNLYREAGGSTQLVCSRTRAEPTWCLDRNESTGAKYFVRAVVNNVEGNPSASTTLIEQKYRSIPLRSAPAGAVVHLGWVGDLTGNGEYDVVVNRISAQAPLVDAYTQDGKFLWRLNTGPLGVNQNGIEGGATTMSNGMWDGLTVFDFNSDGRAEIAVKTANGFVFGDGKTLSHSNDQDQFVSIVNGATGAEITRAPLPNNYRSDGPLQCQFGAGYLDGTKPSLVTKCKNRIGSGAFNLVISTYDFDGTKLTQRWKYLRGNGAGPDFHQLRIMDVNRDGKDEVLDGGYALTGDGTVLYDLGLQGVIHGDRFHITDIDPSRPGLEGFGIQQDNPNGLETYYYDAATGRILRKYSAPNGAAGADMARGTVADLFPNEPGMEYWSFNGLYSASGKLLVPETNENVPWPNFQIQWDGDTGSELLDNNRVGEWNLTAKQRNTYVWRETFSGSVRARGALPFFGDIAGDWREEVIIESSDSAELRIYSTTHETSTRLYSLAHNPAYRNSLTIHGYKQSHYVDYFLGFGMTPPPAPFITPVRRK